VVCREFSCQPPVESVEELERALSAADSR
jgi:uncharacterized protein YyaL (SSP411 family)